MSEQFDSKSNTGEGALGQASRLAEDIWHEHKTAVLSTAGAAVVLGGAVLMRKELPFEFLAGKAPRSPLLDGSGYIMSRELEPAAAAGPKWSWLKMLRGDAAKHSHDPSILAEEVRPISSDAGGELAGIVPLRNPRKIPINQLTAEDLRVLGRDPNPFMRFETAGHWNTAPETLRRLVLNERDSMVVTRAAVNPHTPPDALAVVAKSGDFRMQNAVAKNTATPPDVLQALAGHDSFIVRANVAEHPNTSEAVLGQLLTDGNSLVRANALERLYPTPDIIKNARVRV
jgi:Leucine rich repeat variant